MTAIEFISSVYADACTHGKPQELTEAEAAATITERKNDGVEFPEWVTPELLTTVWNLYRTF